MVEGTCEETKGRVVCGPGISEEFRVNVCQRQGNAPSPLLFIAVVEVISRKASTRDILRKLLYADDLAVVADSEADLQERLVEWKEIWQTKSKSGEDGDALGQAAEQRSKHITGREETEPTRQLYICGWSSLRGQRHGDGNSQENTSWGECV